MRWPRVGLPSQLNIKESAQLQPISLHPYYDSIAHLHRRRNVSWHFTSRLVTRTIYTESIQGPQDPLNAAGVVTSNKFADYHRTGSKQLGIIALFLPLRQQHGCCQR